MPPINGTPNGEPIPGTPNADVINFSQGGADVVTALGSDDILEAGAAFDAADKVDGGTGYDKLLLTGNYSSGVVFTATTLKNVEEIVLGGGFDYALTTANSSVAAGQVLKIDAYLIGQTNTVTFDGSAELDGSFLYYDGLGDDIVTGGAQADNFSLSYGGDAIAHGGGGGDVFNLGQTLTSTDLIDGGAGDDVVYINGIYAGALTLSGSFVQSIETFGLGGDYDYLILTEDSLVAAGANFYVTGWSIGGGKSVQFNGSAETNGTFSFQDSAGNDYLQGGQLGDVFYATLGGHDVLAGLNGDDSFNLAGTLDNQDGVFGGDGKDWLYLDGDYSAGLEFGLFTVSGIEEIGFGGGHDYDFTTHEGTIGAGQNLRVIGAYLTAGDKLTFDASAETDGTVKFGGGASDDTVTGGANDDELSGWYGGKDKLYGGDGEDYFQFGSFFTTADFIDGGIGTDHLYIAANYAGGLLLGSASVVNVEGITFDGNFDYAVTTQNSLVAAGASLNANSYYLTAGFSFVFNGAAETDGSFELTGGEGNDTLTGGAQADTFYLNRGGNDIFSGNGGDDTFYADDNFNANDRINGGVGYDTLNLGGTYSQQFAFGALTVLGIEKIYLYYGTAYNLKTVDQTVAAGANLEVDGRFLTAGEVFVFDGSAETNGSFTIRGGDAADTLKGGTGADLLDGGDGIDSMTGGLGNDIYVVRDTGDSVVEKAGQGTDTIRTTINVKVAGGLSIEKIEVLDAATSTDLILIGNGLDQQITGNYGHNIIVGGGGADAMSGNLGNDRYFIDNAGDVVVEGANQGTADRVLTSISYTLGAAAQVELFTTTNTSGAGAINLTGNGFNQIMHGNAGANILNGGGGSDTMQGFAGNDWYYVDSNNDVVLDGVSQGAADRVFASASFVLTAGAEIEILSTSNSAGTTAIKLTGNGFAQSLGGNAGANVLNGGGGADTMHGVGGNDGYFVDNAGDSVVEQIGGGADRVWASVSYTLTSGQEVELLTTTDAAGTGAIDLTGNNLAQSIGGNAGANVLNGGLGKDMLTGFGGADTFFFNTTLGPTNIDRIADFSVADDAIRLENAIFAGLANGALTAGAFNTGAAATQADDRIIYNGVTGALLFDADGVGGGAGIQFATLDAGLALTNADFFVV